MPRTAAKRILGSRKRKPVRKVNRKVGKTKVKIRIKGSAEGTANAVKELAGRLG